MATYLGKTFSSAGNQRTWTWSGWVKFTGGGSDETIFSGGTGSGASGNRVVFQTLSGEAEKVMVFSGNTSEFAFKTSASLRDKSAWYHFVLAMDTTQATDSNRFKMYINGSQVTNTAQLTYPAQNLELGINNNQQQYIGLKTIDNNNGFNGYIADVHFIDGTQLTAASFGQTDSTTGIWKPKTYSGSYGSNGYKLEFKNAGALGTDTSGNSNTWTVSNAGTGAQVIDTPTNNFPIWNLADGRASGNNGGSNCTYTLGATKTNNGNNSFEYPMNRATVGLQKGKWYWEVKFEADLAPLSGIIGQAAINNVNQGSWIGGEWVNDEWCSVAGNGATYYKYDNSTATGADLQQNDIAGWALDCENYTLKYYKNGTLIYTDTTLNTASNSNNYAIPIYYPVVVGTYSGSNNWAQAWINFGNPAFSISSSNSDANGIGSFEYAVPSGYYAICTKNLEAYG